MQWLKGLLIAVKLWFALKKNNGINDSFNALKIELDSIKDSEANKKYIAIKTYPETDVDYIREMAKISRHQHFRYFLYDMREAAIEKGDYHAVNAITAITKRLRDFEVVAITGGISGL